MRRRAAPTGICRLFYVPATLLIYVFSLQVSGISASHRESLREALAAVTDWEKEERLFMDLSELALPPEGTVLHTALLTTFDLDLSVLSALPLEPPLAERILVFYGDGRFQDCREDGPLREMLHRMLIPVVFPRTENGWPGAHAHGKISLFVFAGPSGERQYRLSVHSRNLYPEDILENQVVFSGRDTGLPQPKTKPLADFLSALRPFLEGAGPEHTEQLFRFDDLAAGLSTVRFEPLPQYACEDYELIGPGMNRASFLQKEYDELLVVCQRIQRNVLSLITKSGTELSKCILVSNLSSVRELLGEGPVSALLLPPAETDPYLHAKVFLMRRGDNWDLFCGSMNLTAYAVSRNLEFMVHLKNPSFIHSSEGFLSSFLRIPKNELRQRLSPEGSPVLTDSPVFRAAASRTAGMYIISQLLRRRRLSPADADRITVYVLSSACQTDLVRFLRGDGLPSVPIRSNSRFNGRDRTVYLLPLRERILLSLVNEALHRYDGCFSSHLYSHIRGRAPVFALSRIRENPEFGKFWLFCADIRNFGESMDAGLLSESIRAVPEIDPAFYLFADRLLADRRYRNEGMIHEDGPAVKPGNALVGFFENVYLQELDARMESRAAFYARCADDFLIGARTREELSALAEEAGQFIAGRKLCLNESKTKILEPGETFSWLGWQISGSRIDFLPEELQSLRRYLRRRTVRLMKECERRAIAPVFRQQMMISHVNELQERLGLTEAFGTVSVPDGLREIDRMLCDMIRAVVSGKTGNAKYRIRYRDIRKWGYRSLVNRWYRYLEAKEKEL